MSCDITCIAGILRWLGQWRACCISSLFKHGIHTFLVRKHCRPSVALGPRFIAYSVLIIDFKGVLKKLKIVALAISVEKRIITIFFNVLLLSYKPSNFARAILPYAAG